MSSKLQHLDDARVLQLLVERCQEYLTCHRLPLEIEQLEGVINFVYRELSDWGVIDRTRVDLAPDDWTEEAP